MTPLEQLYEDAMARPSLRQVLKQAFPDYTDEQIDKVYFPVSKFVARNTSYHIERAALIAESHGAHGVASDIRNRNPA